MRSMGGAEPGAECLSDDRAARRQVARWFYPGLGVKRWLLMAIIGAILFANGVNRWLTAEGAHFEVNTWVDETLDGYLPLAWLQWIFMGGGIILIAVGMRRWMHSIVDALTPDRKDRIVDLLFASRLRAGYRIVAVGGGTGLSTLLRGLKRYTHNLTAVVTVSDDGGSSGRLQKELGILPPGDLRNCLVALADDEALVTDLFQYRFHEGDGLSGHSFGNLFLAAMTGVTGNFDRAVKESSRVLNIKGRVLPATLAVTWLRAMMEDGTVVEGETAITSARGKIESISLEPEHSAPLSEVIDAIRNADAVVLGPGSLYTSIIPNLLVDRIAREIEMSNAVKIYVSNVMTQPGETDDFSASASYRGAAHACGGKGLRLRNHQQSAAAQPLARRLRGGRPGLGRAGHRESKSARRSSGPRRRHRRNDERTARSREARRSGRQPHRRRHCRARDVPQALAADADDRTSGGVAVAYSAEQSRRACGRRLDEPLGFTHRRF